MPVVDGTFFALNLLKTDMDSIFRELDSVNWEDLKNTCPEDDSGAGFAQLIRLKTLEVCTLYTLHTKDVAVHCFPQSVV